MRNRFFLLVFLWPLLQCSPKIALQEVEKPLLQIKEHDIFKEEFLYFYTKNNLNNPKLGTESDIREYLDLFVPFKLKVVEAYSRGYHEDRAFLAEFDMYKKELAKPYLTENQTTDALVKEAYERMKYELRASHILVKIDDENNPQDTLNAYNRAMVIRDMIVRGKDFNEVAAQFSDDPSARENAGDLGYFTAFSMVYPFESAAYALKVGDISMPVKSRFGYHVIKLKDKRPSRGKVRVAHLFIRSSNRMDSATLRPRIQQIYQSLQQGENWESLVSTYSEDPNTKSRGGLLDWFGTGQMHPAMEEAAFALEKKGDFSTPVWTGFGWHIFRLEEKQSLESFESMEANLRARISRDQRSEISRKQYLENLKNDNRFSFDPVGKNQMLDFADSALLIGEWRLPEAKLDQALFFIGEKTYIQKEFADHLFLMQRNGGNDPRKKMEQYLENYVEQQLMKYEEEQLERKFPDYANLLKEYREGMLLFQIMEEEVWSKAGEDTIGLINFYQNHRYKYVQSGQVHALHWTANSTEQQEELLKSLESKDDLLNDWESFQEVNGLSAKKLTMNAKNFWEKYQIPLEKGIFAGANDKSVFLIYQIEDVAFKELEETKGAVISDYQEYLEKAWLKDLNARYEVRINEATLQKIIHEFKK